MGNLKVPLKKDTDCFFFQSDGSTDIKSGTVVHFLSDVMLFEDTTAKGRREPFCFRKEKHEEGVFSEPLGV